MLRAGLRCHDLCLAQGTGRGNKQLVIMISLALSLVIMIGLGIWLQPNWGGAGRRSLDCNFLAPRMVLEVLSG